MSRPRGILGLHVAVTVAGVSAAILALVAALSVLTLRVPSGARLWDACSSFVLPQVTVPALAALLLGSLAFTVLGLAAASLARQLTATRRAVGALRDRRPLDGADAIVFSDPRVLAFCAGYARPRIYVSSGAVWTLTADELAAVLAHETHHARCRDPLRILAVRVMSESLFFVPVLRRLSDGYEAVAELAADASAVRARGGDPRPLAAALLAFQSDPGGGVVGVAPERVDQLLGEDTRWTLPLAVSLWSLVALGALVIVALRTAAAGQDGAMLSLPLLASQACMLTMAILPLVCGASALLAGRRVVRGARPRG